MEASGQRQEMHRFKKEASKMLREIGERLQILEREVQTMQSDPGALKGELKRYREMLNSLGKSYNDCTATLSGKNRRGGPIREAQETHETYGLGNEQILAMHDKKFDKQDQALDQIHDGVKRLRDVGMDINVELDVHAHLLDNIDIEMDR